MVLRTGSGTMDLWSHRENKKRVEGVEEKKRLFKKFLKDPWCESISSLSRDRVKDIPSNYQPVGFPGTHCKL